MIFKDKISVLGLTTAAVIWTAAGIGMATGIGYHFLAICLTVFTIIVLSLFGRVEELIERLNQSRTFNITFKDTDINHVYELEEFLKGKKIKSKRVMMNKINGRLFISITVKGSQKLFVEINEELIRMESIAECY